VTIDAAYWLGTVLEQRGQIAQAEEIVADAVELAARVGDAASDRHQITRLAHKIAFHRGEWRAAISDLQAEGRGASTHARIEFHQDVALWLAVIGGQELEPEISASLADARACAAEAACPRCATELRLAAAEVLVRIGRWEESAESLALWEAAQKHPQVRDRVLQARIKALLEARDGNGTAIAALETVADEAERLGLLLDALWTRIDLGRVLAERDAPRAIETLQRASGLAAEIGALTEQQITEKLLRSLGVRTWRRGRSTDPLTEREQAIVRLIAEGASNPEIAQQLFLSRKTVERHVSNVFKKVGVRNRAELAARVGELEVEGVPR
jgi:DNA-binding NarL/FixJ family response regulator